jgi:hypothetical protein
MTRRTIGLIITSALALLVAPLATAAPPAGRPSPDRNQQEAPHEIYPDLYLATLDPRSRHRPLSRHWRPAPAWGHTLGALDAGRPVWGLRVAGE